MPLSRLAALHGVATSYSPSPGRTVAASDTAVVAVLAALGVAAGTPDAVRGSLAAREAELRERLLPPTVVSWTGATPAPARRAAPGPPPAPDSEAAGTGDGTPATSATSAIPAAPVSAADDAGPGAAAGGGAADDAGSGPATPAGTHGSPGGSSLEAALAALPAGTRLSVRTEQGETRASVERLPPGVHELTATAPDGRTARSHLVVAPAKLPAPPDVRTGCSCRSTRCSPGAPGAWATSATSPN